VGWLGKNKEEGLGRLGKGLDRLGLFFLFFKSILNKHFLNSNIHLFNSNFYTSFQKLFNNYFRDF
jgi:hypothetical protein